MLTNRFYPTTSCAPVQEETGMFVAVNIASVPGKREAHTGQGGLILYGFLTKSFFAFEKGGVTMELPSNRTCSCGCRWRSCLRTRWASAAHGWRGRWAGLSGPGFPWCFIGPRSGPWRTKKRRCNLFDMCENRSFQSETS